MGLGERMGDLDVDILISWCYQPSDSKSLSAKTEEVSGHTKVSFSDPSLRNPFSATPAPVGTLRLV